jgi:hypothetical protein
VTLLSNLLQPSSGQVNDEWFICRHVGGSRVLWNVITFLPDFTVSHPRRQQSLGKDLVSLCKNQKLSHVPNFDFGHVINPLALNVHSSAGDCGRLILVPKG